MINIFETIHCPVCHSKDFKNKFKIEYTSQKVIEKIGYQGSLPQVKLVICNNCSHHFSNPVLKDAVINEYYSNADSEFYLSNAEVDKLKNKHQKIVSKISNIIPKGRILEIGSGKGFLLNYFDKTKYETQGVEPSPSASKFAKEVLKVNTLAEFLDYETFEKESFDVIMLFDVVEHLKDMKKMLKLINHYLRSGGLLVIGTGDIKSFNARIAKSNWGYFGSWEHISFFSEPSMNYLLNSEYTVRDIQKLSYNNSWLKNTYTLCIENLIKRNIFNSILKLSKVLFKSRFNNIREVKYRLTFDHFVFYATKN